MLKNPKEEGGLGLVDLKKKDMALKATWPKILHTEEDYAKIVYMILRCTKLGEDIWRCRLNENDIKCIGIKEDFWQDVLKAWSSYNYYVNFRIENQILWYNSRIKIRGKPFLWGDNRQKGLMFVHQLFEDMKYKSEELVFEQYGLTVLRYNSLKTAIPKEWKNFFCSTPRIMYYPLPPHNFDMCTRDYTKAFSRTVYKFLAEDATLIHNKFMKWRQELGPDFCDGLQDFAKAHKEIYRITNVTKYRSFQYRLLERGIVTNIHLLKWNLKENDLCYYCQDSRETLIHLFVQCPLVASFWQQVRAFILEKFKIQGSEIMTSAENIILNRIHCRVSNISNFVCLIAKQYIYSTRCLQQQISLEAFKARIYHIENVEKYIAQKNNRLSKHVSKWTPVGHHESGGLINQIIQQYMDNM